MTNTELELIKAMVVRSATCRLAGLRHWTPLGCSKRPGGKKCKGHLRVSREDDAVEWHCPICGDNGWIHGWVEGPEDLSGFVEEGALGIRQGKPVSFDMPVYCQLILTFRDSMFESEFLWTAVPKDGKALIRAEMDEWEDLADAIASEESGLDSGVHKRRLDIALGVVESALAGNAADTRQSKQVAITSKLLKGLRLTLAEKEEIAKVHGTLSDMLAAVSGQSKIDEQVRSIAEGFVLKRQVLQCFSALPRDPYHMPLFTTAFSIVLESVEALAARSQPQAFAVYLLGLAQLAEAAPSLPQDENEVADFAQDIANNAQACLEKGAKASTERIKLIQLCLECWQMDRNDDFCWVPDWLADLDLTKTGRRAVRLWLTAQASTPQVRELTKVWESKV